MALIDESSEEEEEEEDEDTWQLVSGCDDKESGVTELTVLLKVSPAHGQ